MSALTQTFVLPPGTLPEGPFDLSQPEAASSSSSSSNSTVGGPEIEQLINNNTNSSSDKFVCEVCACEIPDEFLPAFNDEVPPQLLLKQASTMIIEEEEAVQGGPQQQDRHILPIVCSQGHHVCVSCFSQYIAMTWVNNTRPHIDTFSPENLPHVRCVVSGCTCEPFSHNSVLRHTSDEASSAFLKLLQDISDIATLSKAQSLMVSATKTNGGEGNGMSREQEELAARALLKAQLQSNGLMLMCPACSFGPVERMGCSNLSNPSAQNSCPACGFYSSNSSDWKNWDGEIRDGYVGMGKISRLISGLLNCWSLICLVLTIAATSIPWVTVPATTSSQCINFRLFYVDLGCNGDSVQIANVDPTAAGLCQAHISHLQTGAAFSILSILLLMVITFLTILQVLMRICGNSCNIPEVLFHVMWSINWFFSLLIWAPVVAFMTRSFCHEESLLAARQAEVENGLIIGLVSWSITTALLASFFGIKIFVKCRRTSVLATA